MDQEIITKAKELLSTCDSFLLSTMDRNGFPNTIVVSKPIVRASFYNLKFYVDGEGQTVENILQNKKGNVCCYDEVRHESVLLKGIFSVEDIEEFKLIKDRLNQYQTQLAHKNPVVLSFEVYTVKVHSQTKNYWKDVDTL